MKKATAIIVCFCLLAQTVAHHVVVGLFNLNRSYIAKSLCENRNKPSKKCNGKCYLKKQLKKVEETEHGSSKRPTLKIEKTEVVCLLSQSIELSTTLEPGERVVQNPGEKSLNQQDHLHAIFHPPAVTC